MRPVRAKALIINAFALTWRLGYYHPYTQGAALGYVLLPLRGVLLRLLARHPPTFVAFSPYHRHLLKHAFGNNTYSSAKQYVFIGKVIRIQRQSNTCSFCKYH